MHADVQCQSCSSRGMAVFYQVENIPVHSCLLIPTRQAALRYPRGDLRLGFCHACGFIQNTAVDPSLHDYSSQYEETQAFSPRFIQFARNLADRLIKRYDLYNKDVLEIGCGKGEFLILLCEMGQNRGIGFDPGYIAERTPSAATSKIRFVTDFYSEEYAHVAADFVCCRHTLEHIQPTQTFVQMVRKAIGDRSETIVFFEVPDVARILKEQAFWDLYYEHCSYFSVGSLARLFRSCGFEILHLTKDFGDQYVLLEARPGNGSAGGPLAGEHDVDELAGDVEHFATTFPSKLKAWKQEVQRRKKRGQRLVIWGSGSKAVAYLTTLDIGREVDCVVDINPYKQGMYLAGTGHEIVPPHFLKECCPDVVIIMNPIYYHEIRSNLEQMGVAAELVTV